MNEKQRYMMVCYVEFNFSRRLIVALIRYVLITSSISNISGRPVFYSNNSASDLKVATLNLWNVMFNYEVRFLYIARMIKQTQPDVIGFQEVRSDVIGYGSTNQLQILQSILAPHYKWYRFEPAQTLQMKDRTYLTGMEQEGIGLLSKYPITRTLTQKMSNKGGADTNERVTLYANIKLDQGDVWVVIVHMSYDRQQQCRNAHEILDFIATLHADNVIILGDFNTYSDYEWPILEFTKPRSDASSPCRRRNTSGSSNLRFFDSWKSVHPELPGFTFSNMPSPGLESRPDRVLVSTKIRPTSSELSGSSNEEYAYRYFYHIVFSRIKRIIGSMLDAARGEVGGSCRHDCGPHASCRCGVCVGGGNENACALPNCNECSGAFILVIPLFIIAAVVLIGRCFYLTLLLLLVKNSARRSRQENAGLFGNCCLCNPELYKRSSDTDWSKKTTIWTCLRKLNGLPSLPFSGLPTMVQFLLNLVLISLYIQLVFLVFPDVIWDISSVIPEELYPSDHQMLTVEVTLTI